MNEGEKKWLKWYFLAIVLGVLCGKGMEILLGIALGKDWELLTNLMVPGFTIMALLFIGFLHQKEKEDVIG